MLRRFSQFKTTNMIKEQGQRAGIKSRDKEQGQRAGTKSRDKAPVI